jgi:hypothetical protein
VSYGLDDADSLRWASFPGLLSMPFAKAESSRAEAQAQPHGPVRQSREAPHR